MVDESDYRLPKQQQEQEPTDEDRKQAEETIKQLEQLPWRPHGDTW
jgi:hypothetical protein